MAIIHIAQEQIKAAREARAYGFVVFAEAFNTLVDQDKVIECQQGEKEVGYFGNLVKKDLEIAPGDRAAFFDEHGRPVIVTGTVFGNIITFKRHTNFDGYVVTTNLPDPLRELIAGGNLSHDEHAVSLLCADRGNDNIGQILNRLSERSEIIQMVMAGNPDLKPVHAATPLEIRTTAEKPTSDRRQFNDPTEQEFLLTLDQAIEVAVRDNMLVIDGHGSGKEVSEIIGLIEFAHKGKLIVCPAFKNHFCLNPVEFSAEPMSQLIISPWSVGGVLDARTVLLPTAIKHYKGNGLITRYWTVDTGIVEHVVEGK